MFCHFIPTFLRAEAQPEMVKAMQIKLEAWKKEVTTGIKWVAR
jgi:hypothetical protein